MDKDLSYSTDYKDKDQSHTDVFPPPPPKNKEDQSHRMLPHG